MSQTPQTESRTVYGRKKTKYEFAGVGALVQLVGFVALWIFPFGTVVGLALLIIGNTLSKKHLCSECGNKVEKDAKVCPHCRAEFLK